MSAMKKVFAIICLCALAINVAAQDYNVLDKSEKKRPAWVGMSGNGYYCVGAEGETLDGARQAALTNLRQSIIESIATNVCSQTSTDIVNINSSEGLTFTEDFRSNFTTQSAVMPFLSDISITKAENVYWEKRQDKKTRRIVYEFCMRYPFPASVENAYREQFRKIDEDMVSKTRELEQLANNITSVEDIDRGSVEIKQCISYFFDKRRKEWAEGVYALFLKAPSRISVHGTQEDDETYRIWLEYDGRKMTPSGTPTLKSDCAENLQFRRDDKDFIITFSTLNCLEDEPMSLEISFRIKSKTAKQRFVIE